MDEWFESLRWTELGNWNGPVAGRSRGNHNREERESELTMLEHGFPLPLRETGRVNGRQAGPEPISEERGRPTAPLFDGTLKEKEVMTPGDGRRWPGQLKVKRRD